MKRNIPSLIGESIIDFLTLLPLVGFWILYFKIEIPTWAESTILIGSIIMSLIWLIKKPLQFFFPKWFLKYEELRLYKEGSLFKFLAYRFHPKKAGYYLIWMVEPKDNPMDEWNYIELEIARGCIFNFKAGAIYEKQGDRLVVKYLDSTEMKNKKVFKG